MFARMSAHGAVGRRECRDVTGLLSQTWRPGNTRCSAGARHSSSTCKHALSSNVSLFTLDILEALSPARRVGYGGRGRARGPLRADTTVLSWRVRCFGSLYEVLRRCAGP